MELMSSCHWITVDKGKCGPMERDRVHAPTVSLEVVGRSLDFV